MSILIQRLRIGVLTDTENDDFVVVHMYDLGPRIHPMIVAAAVILISLVGGIRRLL